jgi:hypothetical protein
MSIARLTELGFTEVGSWSADSGLKSGIRFSLTLLVNTRSIYAFVVGQDVKYVGICDSMTTTLEDRMMRYQSMAGAGTNKRIAEKIRKALDESKQVAIYAWNPNEQIAYKGLNVDLVKGLENPLIAELKPQWNIKS